VTGSLSGLVRSRFEFEREVLTANSPHGELVTRYNCRSHMMFVCELLTYCASSY